MFVHILHLLVTAREMFVHILHLLVTAREMFVHILHLLVTAREMFVHILHLLVTAREMFVHILHLLVTAREMFVHILHLLVTAREMLKWCEEHIMGITFLFVTADDVQENSTRFCLEDRYSSAKKTSGIRSHHSSIPLSENELTMCGISSDETCFYNKIRHAWEKIRVGSFSVNSTNGDRLQYCPKHS